MRSTIEDEKGINTYLCSSHALHNLAKDCEIKNVKANIVEVIKYFKYNHFAAAKLREEGNKALVLPQDVRWNTLCDCLKSYLNSWSVLVKIADENRNKIDQNIAQKINNMTLKRSAETLLSRLYPIAVALDRLQSDSITIAEAVEVWKELGVKLYELGVNDVSVSFEARWRSTISKAHLLANLLHPKIRGTSLTLEEKEDAIEYASSKWPFLTPIVMKFQGQSSPFNPCKFQDTVVDSLSPVEWWSSFSGVLDDEILSVMAKLHTAVASSAGVERVFHSFGLVQSKLRNRLGTEKASKLVFVYKAFNPKALQE